MTIYLQMTILSSTTTPFHRQILSTARPRIRLSIERRTRRRSVINVILLTMKNASASSAMISAGTLLKRYGYNKLNT